MANASKYSQITADSISGGPSGRTRVGTLESGLSRRSRWSVQGFTSTSWITPARFSSRIAITALRANGEVDACHSCMPLDPVPSA